MAWPYTPLTTYVASSTPSIKAADLNAIQVAINNLHNVTPDFMPKAWCHMSVGASKAYNQQYGFSGSPANSTTNFVRLTLSVAMNHATQYAPLVYYFESAANFFPAIVPIDSTHFDVGLSNVGGGSPVNLQANGPYNFSVHVFGKH